MDNDAGIRHRTTNCNGITSEPWNLSGAPRCGIPRSDYVPMLPDGRDTSQILRLGYSELTTPYLGRFTWDVSPGTFHLGRFTWDVSPGTFHLGRFTWDALS